MEIQPLRILDASANRACEGLRVVEDYARFALDDAHLTQLAKNIRHNLAECLTTFSLPDRHAARETSQDVGTQITTPAETSRLDAHSVCTASCERVKQSLRSLEEYGKLLDVKAASSVEAIRYRFYTLERCLGITTDSRARLEGANLCVLLDGRNTLAEFRTLAEQLLAAGVPMIQLREKNLTDAELTERTHLRVKLLRQLAADTNLIIIINDRPDIAAATGADGVHLGQDDMSVKDARSILGPRKLIGVSTHNLEQARTAVLDGANYLGAGPTFPSTTKQFDTFPGLDYLTKVAGEITLPTYAIGGITPENLPQVQATGITRAAVSGAITSSANPQDIAQQLLAALQHTPT